MKYEKVIKLRNPSDFQSIGKKFSCRNLFFRPGNLQERPLPAKAGDHHKYKVE
jgi:hypothetical protein